MSSETTAETPLERRLEQFMTRNFPQIWMHGGGASIDGVDESTGEVWITLSGACAGCGISPMTVQALEARMLAEFPEVTEVSVSTGSGFDYGDADVSGAPF